MFGPSDNRITGASHNDLAAAVAWGSSECF
jgi:hypothetical protein